MENQNEKLGVVIALAGALMGCSDPEPNIEIETFNKVNQLFGVNYVQVKVKTIQDDVTVEDIIVNKGNCKIENQNAYTRKPIIPKAEVWGVSVRGVYCPMRSHSGGCGHEQWKLDSVILIAQIAENPALTSQRSKCRIRSELIHLN